MSNTLNGEIPEDIKTKIVAEALRCYPFLDDSNKIDRDRFKDGAEYGYGLALSQPQSGEVSSLIDNTDPNCWINKIYKETFHTKQEGVSWVLENVARPAAAQIAALQQENKRLKEESDNLSKSMEYSMALWKGAQGRADYWQSQFAAHIKQQGDGWRPKDWSDDNNRFLKWVKSSGLDPSKTTYKEAYAQYKKSKLPQPPKS